MARRNPAYFLNPLRRLLARWRPVWRDRVYTEKARLCVVDRLTEPELERLRAINEALGYAQKWILTPEEMAEQCALASEVIGEIISEERAQKIVAEWLRSTAAMKRHLEAQRKARPATRPPKRRNY